MASTPYERKGFLRPTRNYTQLGKSRCDRAEKPILVRYAEWGAMSSAFRPYPREEWQSDFRETRSDKAQ